MTTPEPQPPSARVAFERAVAESLAELDEWYTLDWHEKAAVIAANVLDTDPPLAVLTGDMKPLIAAAVDRGRDGHSAFCATGDTHQDDACDCGQVALRAALAALPASLRPEEPHDG